MDSKQLKTARPSRRGFLGGSLARLCAAAAGNSPSGAAPAPRPLKVVCVGAHPDDPESGCGGTLARYAELGHRVTIIYLTRGEAGIRGRSHEEAAAIRTAEAEAACKILGAKAVFAGQIDGSTELNPARSESFVKLLGAEEPDVVFTHWPLDTHPDHQIASLLALRAWRAESNAQRRFQLYFMEVDLGGETLNFHPTDYVDITAAREKKKAALFAHESQNGRGIYQRHHQVMEEFRGRESGVAAAEGFIHLARLSRPLPLPGL